MYLFIATTADKEAQLYLANLKEYQPTHQLIWSADRLLSQTMLKNIIQFLQDNQLSPINLRGLGVFAGPAGFTNLRVSHAIANALAYSLNIAIVSADGNDWQKDCWHKLNQGNNDYIIKPNYGLAANITQRKK